MPLLCLTLLACSIHTAHAAATSTARMTASTPLGDVDGNGETTVTDIMMIVNHILGNQNPDTFLPEKADVDNDGEITVTDIMIAVNYILGRYSQSDDDPSTPRPGDDDANPNLPVLAPHHPLH